MAAGAIERWVPLTTMRLEGKNKISLDGLVSFSSTTVVYPV